MDAVNFIKERNRMCDSTSKCKMCDLHGRATTCREFVRDNPEEAVKIVEKWGNEHPIITNKMKFEEVFGRTCNENGELDKLFWQILVRPSWWMEEYHEPKGE